MNRLVRFQKYEAPTRSMQIFLFVKQIEETS